MKLRPRHSQPSPPTLSLPCQVCRSAPSRRAATPGSVVYFEPAIHTSLAVIAPRAVLASSKTEQ